jgi:hypothetical protein
VLTDEIAELMDGLMLELMTESIELLILAISEEMEAATEPVAVEATDDKLERMLPASEVTEPTRDEPWDSRDEMTDEMADRMSVLLDVDEADATEVTVVVAS